MIDISQNTVIRKKKKKKQKKQKENKKKRAEAFFQLILIPAGYMHAKRYFLSRVRLSIFMTH